MVFKTNIEDTKISIKSGLYVETAVVLMNLNHESLQVIMNVAMYLIQISVKRSMKIKQTTL